MPLSATPKAFASPDYFGVAFRSTPLWLFREIDAAPYLACRLSIGAGVKGLPCPASHREPHNMALRSPLRIEVPGQRKLNVPFRLQPTARVDQDLSHC